LVFCDRTASPPAGWLFAGSSGLGLARVGGDLGGGAQEDLGGGADLRLGRLQDGVPVAVGERGPGDAQVAFAGSSLGTRTERRSSICSWRWRL
jgi:hypothetical protein